MIRYCLLYILCLLLCGPALAQTKEKQEIARFREDLYREFTDSARSPLPKEKIAGFAGHSFYPVDLSYRVTAKLKRTPGELPFKMATTQGKPRDYVKYGEALFSLHGKPYKLCIYQNLELAKTSEYKDYLFLPFRDLTNLSDTYGGGRYIDLRIPAGNSITIDFNQSYNPYCAYSDRYSCPITPQENILETGIKAGIKKPAGH